MLKSAVHRLDWSPRKCISVAVGDAVSILRYLLEVMTYAGSLVTRILYATLPISSTTPGPSCVPSLLLPSARVGSPLNVLSLVGVGGGWPACVDFAARLRDRARWKMEVIARMTKTPSICAV
jgi:hypothetical protein